MWLFFGWEQPLDRQPINDRCEEEWDVKIFEAIQCCVPDKLAAMYLKVRRACGSIRHWRLANKSST